jgi:tRNA threonylcarbamoyl adenosine modification protein YeaZ
VSLRLLAVDTTSEHGSIAISEGENVLEEVAIDSPDGFGHIVFDEILRLLSRHSLALKDMDGFAAAAGPGSFTGVRVGLTAVKGLAEANGKQAVAVSNLQALASFGSRPLRATVLDAHRNEIYGAVYDASLHLVQDEVVTGFEAWFAALLSSDLSGDREVIPEPRLDRRELRPPVGRRIALAGALPRTCQANALGCCSAESPKPLPIMA